SLYPLLPACNENAPSPEQTGSEPCSQFADRLFAGAGRDLPANQVVCHFLSQTESKQVEEVHWLRCWQDLPRRCRLTHQTKVCRRFPESPFDWLEYPRMCLEGHRK